MPPKRRKRGSKEKSADEYIPRHSRPKKPTRRRMIDKTRPTRVQSTSKSFRRPIQRRSSIYSEVSADSADTANQSNLNPKVVNKNLKCRSCRYTTTERRLLTRHVRTHLKKRSYVCSICKRNFKTQSGLKDHKRLHSECERHQCKDCKNIYKSNTDLIRHVRYKHTHEKPYQCQECDLAFVERSKLIRHMTNHNKQAPYRCLQCNFAAASSLVLKHHLRTHEAQSYKCEICYTTYTEWRTLRTHLRRIHSVTQKSDYSCTICSSHFQHLNDLRKHMQEHSKIPYDNIHQNINENKIYECSECGLNFAQIGNLIGHIIVCDRKLNRKEFTHEKVPGIYDDGSNDLSSKLKAISSYLIKGEVIFLPDTDAEKYIMIKLLSEDEESQIKKCPQELECTVKLEQLKGFDTRYKWKGTNVKLENMSKMEDDAIDKEIEPFFGFDVKDIQSATQIVCQMNLQSCY